MSTDLRGHRPELLQLAVGRPVPHDLPCPSCGHGPHFYLPCDGCACTPAAPLAYAQAS